MEVCINHSRNRKKNTCVHKKVWTHQETLCSRVQQFDRFQSHHWTMLYIAIVMICRLSENEGQLSFLSRHANATRSIEHQHNPHLLIAPWFMHIKAWARYIPQSNWWQTSGKVETSGQSAIYLCRIAVKEKRKTGQKFLEETGTI
jgi:hypothetical protein